MRWMLGLILILSLVACQSSCTAQQVQNDWQTLATDSDSGALAVARLSFWNIFANPPALVTHENFGSQDEMYQVSWGTSSAAESRLDADNFTMTQCWGSGYANSVHNHHSVAIQAGREHIGEVHETLGISEAETWHDTVGVVTITAQKDGLADCYIRVEDNWDVNKHIGIEPQTINGLVIRASIAGTWVRYTWDPIFWMWTREGEVVRYDAQLGYNVAEEIPTESYPGWRGLLQQEFHWKTAVEETENVEITCGINSEGWELFDSISSEQTGSWGRTQDIWDIEAAVHKTIEGIE